MNRRDLETYLFDELTEAVPLRGEAGRVHAGSLARLLGDPQDHARHVHVVGTAGKGTTATALTHLVATAPMSVATHLSPHVYDLRERFLLDGEMVDWDVLSAAAGEVREAAARLIEETGRPPSFFAVGAALSWVLGRRAGVDIMITEAGIGGRVDATNVINRPDKVTVLTNVGLDHADVLGGDVIAIAREKAAVTARRGVLIVGPQTHPEVVEVVTESAAERDSRLIVVDQTITDWREAAAAVATATAAELGLAPPSSTAGPPELPRPPGRGESVAVAGRRVVFDGAHNPMKLEALFAGLQALEPEQPVAIVAIGAGKDLEGCVDVLARNVGCVVVTEFGDPAMPRSHPRSRTAGEVVAAMRSRGVPVLGEHPDQREAADHALGLTAAGRSIVVTGSFFHLAGVRARMLERAARPGS